MKTITKKVAVFSMLAFLSLQLAAQKSDYATINIYREGATFSINSLDVYFNSKNICTLRKKTNLQYKVFTEGRINIHISMDDKITKDVITASKEIQVENGKTYNFLIDEKGVLSSGRQDKVNLYMVQNTNDIKNKQTIYNQENPSDPVTKQPIASNDQNSKNRGVQQVVEKQSGEKAKDESTEKIVISDIDKNIPVNPKKNPYKFALIIGNEDYSSFQTSLNSESDVDYAIRDAKTFKKYAVNLLGVPGENIIHKENADAVTMKRAIKKLKLLIKHSDGKGDIYVYYAGHGFPDEKTKEPYLMPVNVSGTDLEYAVKVEDMYKSLTEYPSRKITVFLDACFSGGARNQGLIAARGVKIEPKHEALQGNIVVFTASSGNQSSLPYKEKHHGLFTYYLLKQLQKTEGNITYGELSEYLHQKVSLKSIMINNKEQTPKTNTGSKIEGNWQNWKFKE